MRDIRSWSYYGICLELGQLRAIATFADTPPVIATLNVDLPHRPVNIDIRQAPGLSDAGEPQKRVGYGDGRFEVW